MLNKNQSGDCWSVTATHATAAVATKDAATGKTHFITHVSASSDKAGSILTVKQGTTTVWQLKIGASMIDLDFSSSPIKAASNALVSADIDGTSRADVNLAGFTLE